MRAEKKRDGTKARVRAMKEKERRIATTILVSIILFMVALSVYFTITILNGSSEQQDSVEPSMQFKPKDSKPHLQAAIVDQLSLTFPNQSFIQAAKTILTQEGYSIDYYSGEKVTVEFYRDLPTRGYKLVILRVHSSTLELEGDQFVEGPSFLFTSEEYGSNKHVPEQLNDQLVIACYTMPRLTYYFGVTPKFVASSMKGNLNDAIVIAMGCEGLNNTKMSEAFIRKGAKAYVGWSQGVSAGHTDQATIQLLQHMAISHETIGQAVDKTMKEVGSDPEYETLLTYYPLEAGQQALESLTGKD